MDYGHSRALAREVRHSPNWPTVRGTLRPRGVAGLIRSRAPVWIQLYLAARDGRLISDGSGGYALLAPPLGGAPPPADSSGLRVLDAHWDLFMFAAGSLSLLGGSVLLVALRATTVGLILTIAGMALIAMLMAVGSSGN